MSFMKMLIPLLPIFSSSNKLEAFQRIGEQLGIACYIQGSFGIILFIAKHYFDDFEGGILTNVNVGGMIFLHHLNFVHLQG